MLEIRQRAGLEGPFVHQSSPQSGVVEDMKATWVMPMVTRTGNPYLSTWSGIHGSSSRTLEQIGTEEYRINGQAVYSAWGEDLFEAESPAIVDLLSRICRPCHARRRHLAA